MAETKNENFVREYIAKETPAGNVPQFELTQVGVFPEFEPIYGSSVYSEKNSF
jgi:hypothetical protein